MLTRFTATDYVSLIFGTSAGSTTIVLDTMEVKGDITITPKTYPTIYQSAAGIATSMATKQARRVTVPVNTARPETICKLNQMVELASQKHTLKLRINPYFDCIRTVEFDPNFGTTIGLPPGTILSYPLGSVPLVGDPVIINGVTDIPVFYSQAMATARTRGVPTEVPFSQNSILEYDTEFFFRSQARGQGPRAKEALQLVFHETAILSLPVAAGGSGSGVIIDAGT